MRLHIPPLAHHHELLRHASSPSSSSSSRRHRQQHTTSSGPPRASPSTHGNLHHPSFLAGLVVVTMESLETSASFCSSARNLFVELLLVLCMAKQSTSFYLFTLWNLPHPRTRPPPRSYSWQRRQQTMQTQVQIRRPQIAGDAPAILLRHDAPPALYKRTCCDGARGEGGAWRSRGVGGRLPAQGCYMCLTEYVFYFALPDTGHN